MARPRIYVNRHGKPVKTNTGVSFNKARRRFYIIRSDGSRQEFKTWEDARDGLAAERSGSIPADQLASMAAVSRYRRGLAHEKLLHDEKYRDILEAPVIGPGSIVVPGTPHAQSIVESAESANRLADLFDVPRVKLSEAADTPATGPKLRDVIKKWKAHKSEDKGGITPHHDLVERRWAEFVKQVGNLFVAELSPAHFRKFHSYVAQVGAKGKSAKWQLDRVSNVKSVLKYTRKKYPEWPWPAGVLDWADSYTAKPYKPKASNRDPLPSKDFKTLIKRCRKWAETDVDAYDSTTQSGRAKRLQAIRKRRDGCQFEAILRLAANCGFDPVDIERIEWADFRLRTIVPHVRFARRKVEDLVGESVERITPLLPSTVEAVKQWRAFEKSNTKPVFRSASKGPYTRDRVSRAMNRLKTEASVDDRWTFKHLRNIGPTLARRGRLSNDEREAFLGHVVGGTSRFYEGDVDETYLIPLVNLIGKEYFDGEAVSGKPKRSSAKKKRKKKKR